MNPYIRMKNGDRVVVILLDLLLTDGTLPHTDADARMMSRGVIMRPSVSFM
jgi:translation initiation factor IF-1